MSRLTRIMIAAVALAAIVAPVAGAQPDFYPGASTTPSPQAAPAASSSSFSWTVAGIGAGALAVLVVLVLVVLSRRRPARRLAL